MGWLSAQAAGAHVQRGLTHPHATITALSAHIHVQWRTNAWYAALLLTGGLLWLIRLWKPHWVVWLFLQPAPSLAKAERVLVFHAGDEGDVFDEPTFVIPGLGTRGFVHHHVRYVYDERQGSFVSPLLTQATVTLQDLATSPAPGPEQLAQQERMFGSNAMDIEVPPIPVLLYREVLTPFYIFQVLAIMLFCFEDYYYYAGCIGLLSLISALMSLLETRRNLINLRNIAALRCTATRVCAPFSMDPTPSTAVAAVAGAGASASTSDNLHLRPQYTMSVDARNLVPGDIILVDGEGGVLPCDAVLVRGSCLVNESMLTGESVPVLKTCLPVSASTATTAYSPDTHSLHTLFCGTQVLQTRSPVVLARVVRTGFATKKGDLVLAILYAKELKFRFYIEALRFVLLLFLLGLCGFVYAAIVLSSHGVPASMLVIKTFDLLFLIVPPALPAAMTVGTLAAMTRLRKSSQVVCTSPPRVNVGGKVKVCCFDKTGTLTEDGLDVQGFVYAQDGRFHNMLRDVLSPDAPEQLVYLLASCQSLALIASTSTREARLIGDPVELRFLESTGWVVETAASATQPHTVMVAPTDSMHGSPLYYSRSPAEIAALSDGNKSATLGNGGVGGVAHGNGDAPADQEDEAHDDDAWDGSAAASKSKKTLAEDDERAPLLLFAGTSPSPGRKARHPQQQQQRQQHQQYQQSSSPHTTLRMDKLEKSSQRRASIIATFPFSSATARMGVVALCGDGSDPSAAGLHVFFKGSPDHLIPLCVPESIPEDTRLRLGELTRRGLRVLALASKPLTNITAAAASTMTQGEAEQGLLFCGLAVLENKPKLASAPVIDELREACIRCVMVTGDSLLTACNVARECRLVDQNDVFGVVRCVAGHDGIHTMRMQLQDSVDPGVRLPRSVIGASFRGGTADGGQGRLALAVTGEDFGLLRQHCPEDWKRLLVSGLVFARMAPEQKAQLVEGLQALGCSAVMCGDGANDCAALRAAHVGIALSEADAAVAAPFTCKRVDIRCVPEIIKEGRASLATTFAIFQFMAMYSFIQFTSALMLYWVDSNLGDFQYLYIDMLVVLTLVVLMGRTSASSRLIPKRPGGSLVSFGVGLSLVAHILLQVLMQALALEVAKGEHWFQPVDSSPDEKNIRSFENTIIFLVSLYMYVGCALALSKGGPYRTPLYRNYQLTIAALVLLVHFLYITLAADWWTEEILELVSFSDKEGRMLILFFGLGHVFAAGLLESGASHSSLNSFYRRLRPKKTAKNEYKRVSAEVLHSDWPYHAVERG